MPYNQQLHRNHDPLNSELLHRYHLAYMQPGSSYLKSDTHDANQLSSSLKIATLPAEKNKEPITPWTHFQFLLNDRWQLGADLPDYNSFVNGSYIPIPRLTYDYGAIKLSTLYMPQIQSYNPYAVMGLYLIITF